MLLCVLKIYEKQMIGKKRKLNVLKKEKASGRLPEAFLNSCNPKPKTYKSTGEFYCVCIAKV
jgi:hypothetical protein